MILKIQVQGDVRQFAWVIPLPSEPVTAREDAAIFAELHNYVEARLPHGGGGGPRGAPAAKVEEAPAAVEVLSRKVVGSYDVAIVREQQAGTLNTWLTENGYRALENSEDVLGFYRRKRYVFACIKVSDAELPKGQGADLHPLRFTFSPGGRDGLYFPMRLTGLQTGKFNVNLYILYNKWINDRLSPFGYAHRGFQLKWRDFDSPKCEPNAGKRWSDPAADPYLAPYGFQFPTVTKLVQKLHPGERYYLTNIQAFDLAPSAVRDWSDDLWLFPYYTDKRMIPFDARPGGPASEAYPHVGRADPETAPRPLGKFSWGRIAILGAAAIGGGCVLVLLTRTANQKRVDREIN
jgi:hypothetical protein